MPIEKMLDIPELKENPFKDRICKVFSTSDDGNMTFEDFLDMMSVFSQNAPKHVKIEYAFRIYDFDEDNYINESDLKRVVCRLCGENELDNEALAFIVTKILQEADLDEDKALCFDEFEHVLEKTPDFVTSFHFRL